MIRQRTLMAQISPRSILEDASIGLVEMMRQIVARYIAMKIHSQCQLTCMQLQRLKASRNVFSAHLDNLFSKLL